jgi:hypothetical protein
MLITKMKNIYKKSFRVQGALMILVLICSASFTANASTATWNNGASNGIWSDATNWTNGTNSGIPGAGQDVLIPNTATGDPVLDAGDVALSITIESAHTVTTSSGYDLTVGTFITGGGTLDLSANSGTVIVGGNFTIATLTPGTSSTVTLNGASLQNISANTFHSLVDNNSGSGSNVATLTGDITVTGNITGTGTLKAGSHNLTANGNISVTTYDAGSGTTTLTGTISSSNFISGTSLFILNGTGTQILGAYIFNNLEVDNTGVSETLGSTAEDIEGNFSGTGTFDGGSETITVDGNITIAAIIPDNTIYVLSGASNQNIANGYTFYEVHTNNAAGFTLTGGDVTVTHALTMGSGVITLGSNNLSVTTSTGLTGTFGSGSYIKTSSSGGVLKYTGATSGTIFPVGDASYNPIVVTPATSNDVYNVSAIDGVTDASGVQATANTVNVTWSVKPTSVATQTVVVTPQWNSSQDLTGFSDASSNDYVQYRTTTPTGAWNATTAGTPTSVGGSNYQLPSGNITMTNSPTYYLSLGNGQALPVTLVAFNANYKDGRVNLNWLTASEINNSHFEIERSATGADWAMIGTVQGNGNSQHMNSYVFTDNLLGVVPTGTFYYRLKQVDFNGNFAYSEIKSVTIAGQVSSVSTYPNPTVDVLNVNWTSNSDANSIITIKDLSGKELYSEVVSGAGVMSKQIDMTTYKTGTYFVQLVSDNNVTSKMIVRK